LRNNTKAFCRVVAQSFDCPGPIYEFGSFQTRRQGEYADLRGHFPGREFVGCDLRAGPGVDRISDVSDIDIDDESVGTVLAIETFEHVFEVRRAFDEVYRVLRPGGLFVVTLPLNFRLHGFPDDFWRMTPTCLRRMMAPYAARLTGAQGYHRFPHTVLGVGVKGPAPADAPRRLERVSRAFQGWLEQAEVDLPLSWKIRRTFRQVYRSKGERLRLRHHFKVDLALDVSDSFTTPASRASRSRPEHAAEIIHPSMREEATMPGSRTERLLILGLDGATWSVLDPMIARGLMPNLAALLGRSSHGTLRSCIPPVTSAAWTTMMTGCDPSRHGVFDHRYLDAAAGRLKVNHAGRVRVPTFWHQLSESGRSVVSLNLPVTYPPLNVRGIVVSGMDAPHLEAALSGAPAFAEALRAEVPGYHLRSLWKRPPRDLAEMVEAARQTADVFEAEADAGRLADRMAPDWSALLVQFQNLDPFQHRAWRYLNVDETGIDDPAMNAAAASVMEGLDRAIGRLCELADRRGAGVMVVSDHGFGPCLGRVHANRILIDAGVARMPGVAGRLRRRATQAADHLRLWGAKRDDPEARSASFDQSIAAQFPFDWRRTLAFAPHQDTAAMVYLNSADRRPGAPLTTPRQVDDAKAATIAALSEAKHPETGLPLFPSMISTADAYGIDPAREGYPDLIAPPDEPYWVRCKLAPGRDWLESDPMMPGTHRPEGVIALSGPGIQPGRTLKANLRDVAPSILTWFGLPIPEHVEGEPLACLTGFGWQGPNLRRDPGHEALAGNHQAGFEYTPEEQAMIEQRLADLGYLE
jgi:predicted AlkP superfamily phosphohydrolase/phosphomutase/SAM-dependent methyltransferase